ncbi:unnamed protein product [Brachionus calyciflorus]|uniref:CBM21 domain-containing protein n=1 Tax=Brachionus calyciflorus TaxID=104777 RepID=A0A814I144_9BILA|nr:unnamed protein product [Brachionus calyciflorus]
MTSLAMFSASSIPDDLDYQLEKLSLKLVQNSIYNKTRTNPHIQKHTFIYNSKSSSLFSITDKLSSISSNKRETQKSDKKKMVRFADSLGFELVTVKILSNSFKSEILNSEEDEESEEITSEEEEEEMRPTKMESDPNSFIYDNINFTWECLFEQPGILPDFYGRLSQKKVLLEAIYSNHFKLNGFVRVSNLSLHKKVFIRYSLNNWKTFTDSECTYVINGTSEQTDRFKFSIVLDKPGLISTLDDNIRHNRQSSSPVLKLEFAVCYEVKSSDCPNEPSECSYWDNNNSNNYQYNCFFKIINPFKV